ARILLLSTAEAAHLGRALNGGRHALLGAGILRHRDHRRVVRIWRCGNYRCEHRSDTVFCLFSNLPGRPGHGGGRPSAAAYLNAKAAGEIPQPGEGPTPGSRYGLLALILGGKDPSQLAQRLLMALIGNLSEVAG